MPHAQLVPDEPDTPDLFEVDPPVDVEAETARMVGDAEGVVSDVEAIEYGVETAIASEGRWRISTDGEAEWAMATLARAAQRLGEFQARRDAYIDRARRWYEAVSKDDHRTVAFMDAHLADYALRVREASPRDGKGEPKVKTVRLVAGDIATRSGGGPRVVIVDKDALIDWARKHLADAVTTTHDVKVSALREHVEIVEAGDGWAVQARRDATLDVPFVEVEDPPPTATVKPLPPEE